MPKNSKQKQKLLYILKLLYEKSDQDHGVTMSQILEYLEENEIKAERKSIYDDIKTLKDFGVDIISTKSKTVRYFIAGRSFELYELKLLVDAVQSSKFITHKKTNELIKKLEGLSSEHDASKLQRQVFVANRIKAMNEKTHFNIDSVHEAINSGNKISFFYYQWEVTDNISQKIVKKRRNDGNRYVVSPWALCWDDENYYLIAFDSNAQKIKHYRIDKMESVEILHKEKRDGKKYFDKFDTAVYSKQVFGMYGGNLVDIKIRFDKSLIGVVVDKFSKNVFITVNGDNTFDMNTKVTLSPNFYGFLFGLKDKAKIISPKSAREEFLQYIEDIRNSYL